ncbi:MAG: hypothetical protein AAB355_00310 [Patescibacteria group bacterium]
MSNYNFGNADTSNYSDIAAHAVDSTRHDVPGDQEETVYINERFKTDWDYFNEIPKLNAAIIMKAIWTVGKGYTCDDETRVILDHVVGNGKQTFLDILFDLIVTCQAVRDSYAEIVRDEETGQLVNLRILDPRNMRTIYASNGMILRYELFIPKPQKGVLSKIKNFFTPDRFIKFEPHEILHFSNKRFGGEIHGRSVPETMEKIILADDENFKVMKRLTRFQAVPFIIFKLKSDDAATIANFKANIKDARENGEDLIVPDDENLLSWEVVQVNPSSVLMEWRRNMNNEFYQAVGMPLVLFGTAGSTESGGKIEYLGHETVFENDQLKVENQIWAQLGLRINLNSPTSLLENLQTDENKDAQNALGFSPNDVQAGNGK